MKPLQPVDDVVSDALSSTDSMVQQPRGGRVAHGTKSM
jgi:hypothetical protein